ncbi:hypothetical protein DYB36_013318 [Aphanomyces astaci]|uniref:Peptidase M13 N-terminal domain-containing protein n=1 Tax=Aphanomyces astaci TaxID=112090 RepID=A0A397A1K7_APHAT|nr:hypothetical protein DYB36_013318 [Aphanomyces astaci]
MGIRLDALNDLHACMDFASMVHIFGQLQFSFRSTLVKVLVSLSVLAAVATAGSVTELPDYACGAWYNDAVIPPDIHRIDTSFNKIGIQNEAVLTKIFSHNKTKLGKCGELYNSCLDTATLSSLGLTPLEDWFKAIRSASTKLDLLIVAGELVNNGIPAFVNIYSRADDNDSTKNALFGFRAPLPLDSFYYTPSQWEYAEPMHKEVAATVPVITRFEDTLANVDLNELQEIEAVVSPYTALTYYQMDQKYPLLIGSWLKTNGFNLLKNTTLDNLRTVMENKLINASSKHLTPEFRKSNWNFFGKTIPGEEVEPSREKFCISETRDTIDEFLGQYFLDEVWSVDTAKTADELVKALKSSFTTDIATTEWLDNSTHQAYQAWSCVLYIASMLQLAGYTAEKVAAAVPVITSFEHTLAGVDLIKLGTVDSPYTQFTYSQLDKKYPLLVGSWLKPNTFDIYDQWCGSNDWVGLYYLT